MWCYICVFYLERQSIMIGAQSLCIHSPFTLFPWLRRFVEVGVHAPTTLHLRSQGATGIHLLVSVSGIMALPNAMNNTKDSWTGINAWVSVLVSEWVS